MSTTRFLIVRHGETEWNAVRHEMGQLDSPLTATGVQQAEAAARALRQAEPPATALYSIDLGRAEARSPRRNRPRAAHRGRHR